MTCTGGAIFGDPNKGLGILNNEKYAGRLIWNRTTWPRDPEQDGKQVRRELPEDQWVVRESPELRVVPQELWDAAHARMARRSRATVGEAHHARQPRLLSGLLTCGRCGGRYVLRGRHTYSCATRQNRGKVVCDCMATVNAMEAEQAILNLLEALFCDDAVLARLEAAVRRRLTEARRQRARQTTTGGQLRRQLAEVEGQISRLVQWIAKGKLVEDLETQMMAAGQVEPVKRALSRLVTSIEVHEYPRPGRKRPGAKLEVRGNLEALLQLTGKVESVGSPGGIRTLVTIETPAREWKLQGRWCRVGSAASDQRQAAYAL